MQFSRGQEKVIFLSEENIWTKVLQSFSAECNFSPGIDLTIKAELVTLLREVFFTIMF
jgi:hypothetical protein